MQSETRLFRKEEFIKFLDEVKNTADCIIDIQSVNDYARCVGTICIFIKSDDEMYKYSFNCDTKYTTQFRDELRKMYLNGDK